jgi:hypothetical protein
MLEKAGETFSIPPVPSQPLEYSRLPPPPPERLSILLLLLCVAPVVDVMAFVIITAVLQDSMITGDGRSWNRAAMVAALFTAPVALVALLLSARAVVRQAWPRALAVFALAANVLALAVIVYGVIDA